MKKILLISRNLIPFIILLLSGYSGFAQTAEAPAAGSHPVDNLLRSNGMIYVVVGVIVIILGGLLLYLNSIDKKISRMEKEIGENK